MYIILYIIIMVLSIYPSIYICLCVGYSILQTHCKLCFNNTSQTLDTSAGRLRHEAVDGHEH